MGRLSSLSTAGWLRSLQRGGAHTSPRGPSPEAQVYGQAAGLGRSHRAQAQARPRPRPRPRLRPQPRHRPRHRHKHRRGSRPVFHQIAWIRPNSAKVTRSDPPGVTRRAPVTRPPGAGHFVVYSGTGAKSPTKWAWAPHTAPKLEPRDPSPEAQIYGQATGLRRSHRPQNCELPSGKSPTKWVCDVAGFPSAKCNTLGHCHSLSPRPHIAYTGA